MEQYKRGKKISLCADFLCVCVHVCNKCWGCFVLYFGVFLFLFLFYQRFSLKKKKKIFLFFSSTVAVIKKKSLTFDGVVSRAVIQLCSAACVLHWCRGIWHVWFILS